MKKFFLACILTLVFVQTVHAQFSDNFSDNDFSSNPPWQGDDDKFVINGAQQLALHGSAAGASYLSSSFSMEMATIEWRFYVKQSFSPSSSNYARVYLASDNSDLSGSLNGYYLQLGEAGSDDAIELFKQTGMKSVSICRGKNGTIASAFQATIKVIRTVAGGWTLYSDFTGGENFIQEAFGMDSMFNSSSFFGIVCSYTASNASNFLFDDFYAGPPRIDTVPPSIQSIQIVTASELEITFSEQVQASDAEMLSNYFVSDGLDNPDRAELQSNGKTVTLFFAKKFPDAIPCTITVKNEIDLTGNEMTSVSDTFTYSQPTITLFKDVVLTEIFADPNPQIGLPAAEFVEIFNRSSTTVDLTNWKFTDGTSTGLLTSKNLLPGNYLILTSASNASLFSSYNNVMGVSNFPTLNNGGDALVLKNVNGVKIDSVNYDDSWYRDDDKKEGGWSLELIDPNNTCAESENWIASEDSSGGTPCKENSVFANKPDLTGPMLLSAVVLSSDKLKITFSEKLDKNIPLINNFAITPSDSISAVAFSDASLTALELSLKNKIEHDVLYSITVQNIYDCAGNQIQKDFSKAVFSQSEQADSLDILVNEILFNPRPTGVDFVEVYNNSSKFINLKNWSIAGMENGLVVNEKSITPGDYMLYPSSYLVLTTNGDIVKGEYPASHEDTFLKVVTMPALNDDYGTVVLLNGEKKIIDYMAYTKGMHSAFVKDDEGVSLERIAFGGSTNDPQNWKSASSTVGYATPGYLNSSARSESIIPDESVKVDPEIFIPLVGQPDFTQILYNFNQASYVANVTIFDIQGHEIKELANNEILGAQGSFRWEGDRDNGSKARVGYYVVNFEVFDSKGNVKTFHKRVVIATKF